MKSPTTLLLWYALSGLLFALSSACTGSIGGGAGAPPGANGSSGASGTGAMVGTSRGGTGATSNGTCGPSTAPRIWRLSDEQFVNAVSDLLPGVTVPAVTTPGRVKGEFVNMADAFPVTGALASDVRSSAKAVAAAVVKDVPGLLKCQPGQPDMACVGAFIDRFVPRAFRRPIDNTERDGLLAVYGVGAQTTPADGVRLVLEAVLQSPSFLYRSELGAAIAANQPTALTPYELATALSFLVLDSTPDDELFSVAQDGSITQPAVFTREADRLLQTPRARTNLSSIFLKWLGLGGGVITELPAATYPEYDDALRQSMLEESTRFVTALVTQGGTLRDLMTSRATFVDSRLAAIYGVPYPAGSAGFIPTTLPPERSGILTQAAVVTSKSRGHQIVIRGKFVRRDLFCQNIPSPPPTVNIMQFDGSGLTERQQSAKRTADAVCGSCHSRMDPIGISFEKFDAIAHYRPTAADGTAVDSAGQLMGTDVDGPIGSPNELANRLGQSAMARACVSQSMLSYALGRDLADADRCEQDRVAAQVQALGGHLEDLIDAIVRSPVFGYRTGGQ